MDSTSTTLRMIVAIILILSAAMLLVALLKNKSTSENKDLRWICFKNDKIVATSDKKPKPLDNNSMVVYDDEVVIAIKTDGCVTK